ncbi:MAG: CRTAC1 family protein [Thermoanaerobaculia bacterium]|nr:CRTAC1 family protein [Thermoanaerobaculia bacterium]
MRFAWLISLALSLLTLGPGTRPADAASGPTAEETRQELMAVCEEIRASENPYLGRGILEELDSRLSRPLSEFDRIRVQGRYAAELVRLGRHEEAIRRLDTLQARYPRRLEDDPWLRTRLHYTRGLAWFQLGEDRNCVDRHTPRSCIVPFADEALHRRPDAASAAASEMEKVLAEEPGHVRARWLLNLARLLSDGDLDRVPPEYRLPEDAFHDESGFPTWRDRGSELGISPFDLSGGALMDDFDGDGDLDLVSSTWDPCDSMKAYRNDGRDRFVEVTGAWGLHGQLGGLNLVHGDYDGDGALDIVVLRGAWRGEEGRIRNSLLRNRLHEEPGRFVDVTARAGLAYPAYPSQTAAWADFDDDGDLDLFVGTESPVVSGDPQSLSTTGPARPYPYPSQLFVNRGDGTFVDRARALGLSDLGFVKGATWGDVDDDGDPDLFASIFGYNRLLLNEGRRFVAAEESGVEGAGRQSFATWFFDYDDDGDLDLFVADYGAPLEGVLLSYLEPDRELPEEGHPHLYQNRGDGTFEDVSTEAGLTRPELPMGVGFGDLDQDGRLDFYLGTGLPDLASLVPNVMYRNVDGTRFENVTFSGGFGQLQKGHAVAFGDIDGDGDEDLYQQLGGAYPYDAFGNAFLRNPSPPGSWIVLRLDGGDRAPRGHGARIAVEPESSTTPARRIHRLVGTLGSFSGASYQEEIGLGAMEGPVTVEVDWSPSVPVTRIRSLENNRYYRIVRREETGDE